MGCHRGHHGQTEDTTAIGMPGKVNEAGPPHHPANHRWRPPTVAPRPRSATNLTTLEFGKRSKSCSHSAPTRKQRLTCGSFHQPRSTGRASAAQTRHFFIFSAVDARSKQLSTLVSATVHPLPRPAQTQTRAGHRGSVGGSWEQFNAVERSSERRAAPTLLPHGPSRGSKADGPGIRAALAIELRRPILVGRLASPFAAAATAVQTREPTDRRDAVFEPAPKSLL